MVFDDVDKFILSKKKAVCSWCGGREWGIHTIQVAEPDGDPPAIAGDVDMRGLPQMRISESDARGSVSIGAASALPAVVAECIDCGKLDFFNYFSVMRMILDAKAKEKEKDNPAAGSAVVVEPSK